mmetsp:Transcript_36235/g.77287  ORF Transcript_36235/g.77287 Transcript_36235/m.77287 type:complete len:251 (+) Transcript_36235:576-1328(+)
MCLRGGGGYRLRHGHRVALLRQHMRHAGEGDAHARRGGRGRGLHLGLRQRLRQLRLRKLQPAERGREALRLVGRRHDRRLRHQPRRRQRRRRRRLLCAPRIGSAETGKRGRVGGGERVGERGRHASATWQRGADRGADVAATRADGVDNVGGQRSRRRKLEPKIELPTASASRGHRGDGGDGLARARVEAELELGGRRALEQLRHDDGHRHVGRLRGRRRRLRACAYRAGREPLGRDGAGADGEDGRVGE